MNRSNKYQSLVGLVGLALIGAGLCACNVKFDSPKKIVDAGPPVCGNHVKEGEEVCDGSDLGGETCASQGFDEGELLCLNDCTGFNMTYCKGCGNGQREEGEACDGQDLGFKSCVDFGGVDGKGVLTCTADCQLDSSRCFTGEIGAPCEVEGECDTGLICLPEGERHWPEGFCTRICSEDSDCSNQNDPEAYVCVPDDEGNAYCMERCVTFADCRAGYACFDIYGDGKAVCWPHCTDDAQCNQDCTSAVALCNVAVVPEAGDNGVVCGEDGDCKSGYCFKEYPVMGGYCVNRCALSDKICPQGSACVNFYGSGRADFGLCLQACVDKNECHNEQLLCLTRYGSEEKICWWPNL